MITRRQMLSGIVGGGILIPTLARGEDSYQDPLILRTQIAGVDPRYSKYASDGPYLYPSSPIELRTKGYDFVIFAPKGVKTARLIVFSHMVLADPSTYRELLWHWVSHGFVVAAPRHSDSVIDMGPTIRKTSKLGGVSQWPIAELLEDPHAWSERVDACVTCLTEAKAISDITGIDISTERPIIAGHGYGAYVAQVIMGASVVDGGGTTKVFADPRFFAGIILGPQGPGVMGLRDNSWANIGSPMLYVLSENDFDFTEQPYDEKVKSYLLSKPGYKHMALLKDGSSNTFAGQLAKRDEQERKLFEVLRALTTCYLFAYGNYDSEAFGDLTSDFFARMSLGIVSEDRK